MLFRGAMLGLVVMAFGVGSAWACSCAADPTAQVEFGRSAVVVRVRLERTVGAKTDAELFAAPEAMHRAVMRVESVYKGDSLIAGRSIEVAQGHGSFCGWFFSEEDLGREFLLYMDAANTETKVFHGPICGRSRNISQAAIDLNYLERRAELDGKTVLAGVVKDARAEFRGKQGVTVTVRGGGRTFTKGTGKDGYFEIKGLRPGRYTVSVPEGFYFTASPERVHGGFAKPKNGAAELNVDAAKMTEIEIHLN